MGESKNRLLGPVSLRTTAVYLACMLTAFPALAHDQQAVSGGKRVQPTPETVQERTKEHPTLESQRRPVAPRQKPIKDRAGKTEQGASRHTHGNTPDRQ
jgi:hypothetical protein